jgi:pectate lyase
VATGALITSLVIAFATNAFAATLFSDNFDDNNSDGWTRSGGSWSVVADGSPVFRQTSTGADAKAQAGSSAWTDYAAQTRVKPLAFNGTGRYAAVLARAQNMTNYYYLGVTNGNQVVLGKRVGGAASTLASAPFTAPVGTWQTLRLEAFGSSLRGVVNGAVLVSATDGTFAAGRTGLATFFASASFDDVAVTTDATPGPSGSTASPTASLPSGTCNQSVGPVVGFASVNALGQNGTTGGSGGPVVEVDTAPEFLAAIAQSGPLVICVRGMITLPGPMHDVTSNKSIIGIGTNSGFTNGGLNVGLPISDSITTPPANAVRNVIIRNLVFRNATDDSINVQMFSHHVWIDHNDLSNGFDGLIDIKRGSSYITVSWNHTHNHTKNMLLGHDDSNAAQDVGFLKVTYHHNWFDQTPQRNPRVRFGEPVHVFNNYYLHNTDVGVACQANAGCMVEGNYFENTEETVTNHYAGPTGRCVARNNVFVGESGAPDCSGTVQEPSVYYSYTVDDPNGVRASVMAGAGPH